jgi:hypothetical protein
MFCDAGCDERRAAVAKTRAGGDMPAVVGLAKYYCEVNEHEVTHSEPRITLQTNCAISCPAPYQHHYGRDPRLGGLCIVTF